MYFLLTTLVQRFSMVINLQPDLAARERLNSGSLFKPHPPQSFGLATLSHATQGKTEVSLEPAHKNLQHIFLIFSITPLGNQVKAAQYTGMANRTDFMRVNLPALESHLKLQCDILASIFAMSQFQSSFL